MKIGFDGKRAVQNFTGLGNYSRYVADILCRQFPDNEYVLYAPKRRKSRQLDALLGTHANLSLALPATRGWNKFRSLWRVWGISPQLKNEKIDIFHGLSNELPLNIRRSGIRSVVTIHDLIFIKYPQYYPPIDRKIYEYKFRKACQNADRIIAVSECTKRDIVRFFGIPEEKIDVVYQGCDESFSRPSGDERKREVRAKHNLPERFILNVGSIEERKNALLAAKAVRWLPDDVHLVIIGKETAYTGKIRNFVAQNNLERRVHILHNIPFADLPTIYQMAEIFVYPSFYEGFGIPIIEALHSGVPVVAATGSCLEEAGGPDSVYVNPNDENALHDAFRRILSDGEMRRRMIEKGKIFVKKFSEAGQAEQIVNIYKTILQAK